MHSQESGVVVTVITASPDTVGYGDTIELFALIDEMQRSGIYVRETDGEGEHYAVIDKKLLLHRFMDISIGSMLLMRLERMGRVCM